MKWAAWLLLVVLMQKTGKPSWGILFFSGLVMALCLGAACGAQELAYNDQAEIDAQGNIFVSSDGGKLIWMGNTKRCAEARQVEDRQTVGCLVAGEPEMGESMPAVQLEIYLKGGQKKIIEPGGPILEWHFWENGRQVAVFFGAERRKGTHLLYDAGTGGVIERVAEPSDESQLPQWAKDSGQIQDETVPEGEALKEERTKWMAKVLREIEKIQPGMTREDLVKVFTGQGGLSTRHQRTYVFAECPVIKVDVKFKAVGDDSNSLEEKPEDVIVSISRPYLAGSTVD